MSTKTGNDLQLAKRLQRVETALAALERHPAANAAVAKAVERCRYALFPLRLTISISLCGKAFTEAFQRIAEWAQRVGIAEPQEKQQ